MLGARTPAFSASLTLCFAFSLCVCVFVRNSFEFYYYSAINRRDQLRYSFRANCLQLSAVCSANNIFELSAVVDQRTTSEENEASSE